MEAIRQLEDEGDDPWDDVSPDEPSVESAPPPPPPPISATMARRSEPSQPPKSMVDLGPPPLDDLDSSADWRYKLLLAQAHDAAMDTEISQAERRKEVRVILAAAAQQFPEARRQRAIQEIRESREKLDARRKQKTSARLEPVPESAAGDGGAKVIQIRGDRG